MNKFGVMNSLNVVLCKDAEDATAQGYVYRDPIKALEIEKVVVVANGTEAGNSTVDLLLIDEQGNKFVVMITGNLLKSIPY
jgi:hypothetical protein